MKRMTMRYLILILGFIRRIEGDLEVEPRIIGGIAAQPGEFPFFVAGTSNKLCGGTLIWPDIVLTAAHCKRAYQVDVIIGSSDVFGRDGAERIMIDFLKAHEDYVPGPESNDIMLVKLQQPSVNPFISLNFDPNFPYDNEMVTTMGFGVTQESGNISSSLQKVDLFVMNTEDCRERLGNVVDLESHICAGVPEGGRDSCDGDSGGPLLPAGSYDTVYGITSFGAGCARPNTPAAYTRVSYYKDWIESFICLNSASPPASCWGEDTLSPTPIVTPFPTVTPTTITTPPTVAPTSTPVSTQEPTLFPTMSPVPKQTSTTSGEPPKEQPVNAPPTDPKTSQEDGAQTMAPTFFLAGIQISGSYAYSPLAIIWLSYGILFLL
ncbi:plasma kallikrein [Fistulifera solaris]|uniref:Plasma kallikrein n=1 Tax=Fistulifera solaris TaxID=1519565 RepID=A0A1Z5JS25_FISSO|nr:plasma kallikrein [Fistulifera solaris]|eukprot:GAX16824.1 plasma kallikrein [Fistulifera solaris]